MCLGRVLHVVLGLELKACALLFYWMCGGRAVFKGVCRLSVNLASSRSFMLLHTRIGHQQL